jgi:hypothetical protein
MSLVRCVTYVPGCSPQGLRKRSASGVHSRSERARQSETKYPETIAGKLGGPTPAIVPNCHNDLVLLNAWGAGMEARNIGM